MVNINVRRRRYAAKLRDLLNDNFPGVTIDAIQDIKRIYESLDITILDIWCSVSKFDTKVYTPEDLSHGNKRSVGTSTPEITGYCVRHEVFHHYNQFQFRKLMKDELENTLNKVRSLGFTPITYELNDHLVNPYHSQTIHLVEQHVESLGWAREVYAKQRRADLAYAFTELTEAQKEHYYVCGRKKKYENEEAADTALTLLPASTPNLDTMQAYKCRMCEAYHLGHGKPVVEQVPRFAPLDMSELAAIKWSQKGVKARHYAANLGYYEDNGLSHEAVLEAFPKAAVYDRGWQRALQAA